MRDFEILTLCEHTTMLGLYRVIFARRYMQVNIDCAKNSIFEMHFHYECAWLHALPIVFAVRSVSHESRMLSNRMSTTLRAVASAPLA